MNPRKNKPVLFELMSGSPRARGRVAGPGTESSTPPSGRTPVSPAVLPGAPSSAVRSKLWKYSSGRLNLALGWPHLAVVAVLLVILVVTAFQIGHSSGKPPAPKNTADLSELLTTPTPAPAARSEAPPPAPAPKRSAGPVATPALPAGEDAGPGKAASHAPPDAKAAEAKEKAKPKEPDTGDSFAFAANSFYVVVQHFRIRDRDRAVAAKEFLRAKGIECTIRPGGGDLELVATEAFNSESAARDLVKRVLDFGKEYWNSGGGYEFTGAKARKF